MVFGTQRMRPLGHTAEEMGLHSTQPQNSTAETTLPDPCSARRDKPPPSASHFPLEGSPGWKLQVSGSIYRGEFRLQNPRASRLGPSFQGHLPALPHPTSSAMPKSGFPSQWEHSNDLILFTRYTTCGTWHCCSVPVAVVSPLLVLAPSPVVHGMVSVLPPTLLQDLGCDGHIQTQDDAGFSALGSAPHEQDEPPISLQ